MRNLPYYFIGSATLFALAGMLFGMYMAGSQNHLLASAHAHNNLLGWVSMAIFGLYYRAAPGAITRAAQFHFVIALLANLIFPFGIGLAVTGRTEALAIMGGTLQIVSMLTFAVIVWRNRAALATA
jgi:hypothetical protein